MRLLAITDLHNNRPMLARIVAQAGPVDLVLLGGDVTNFGTPRDVRRIVEFLQGSGTRVRAVAGNCDSAQIEQWLVHEGLSLFERGEVIGSVALQGLSAMPPWHPDMYHFQEAELAEALRLGQAQLSPAEWHVVLSHAPPLAERVDRTNRGLHVGSTALREFIDRVGPDLVLCGHIHEGRGVERIGRTEVVNCGPAVAGSYAVIDLTPTRDDNSAPQIELRSVQ